MRMLTGRPILHDRKLADRGDDLYQTPPEAVRALLRVERIAIPIWEPCCGPGAIARVLRQAGHQVIATDLVDYQSPDQDHAGWDFLMERSAPPGVEAIVSNFPFKLAPEMIRHGLTLVSRLYLLLRFAFIEAQGRADILESGLLRRVHVFANRLPMMHRDGWQGPKIERSAYPYAWFVWDRDHPGPTTIKRIWWKPEQVCAGCGKPFSPNRSHALTCSPRCRMRVHRKRYTLLPSRGRSVTAERTP
jgi:hypothetical protein